ncbi:MAG: hypothetical protein J0I20_14680 [Chloroflexi bacterium]|mgnify:CR=1 FL=1|nr:hypothetical protein [Chloroflexota bacterium]OJW02745.1 MAG: hypothetical protein BGO39_05830 [Chloroflexi bacterium 54-19]
MEKNELNNEKEPTTSQPEMLQSESQDGELTDEELDTVDGGLLPAVKNATVGPVVASKPAQAGIIAVLIGL